MRQQLEIVEGERQRIALEAEKTAAAAAEDREALLQALKITTARSLEYGALQLEAGKLDDEMRPGETIGADVRDLDGVATEAAEEPLSVSVTSDLESLRQTLPNPAQYDFMQCFFGRFALELHKLTQSSQ